MLYSIGSNDMVTKTYTQARANLAELMDKATHDRETIIVTRRGEEDVAIIAADELRSLQESAYLLRSPANAERLLRALERSRGNDERTQTVDELRKELGL
jgi:antitoxin YefM